MGQFPRVALLQKAGTGEKTLVFLEGDSYLGAGINIPLSWWKEESGVFTDPHIDGLCWGLTAFRPITL